MYNKKGYLKRLNHFILPYAWKSLYRKDRKNIFTAN